MSSVHLEPQDLPEIAPHNHGRTTAAWVTNWGLVIAALLMSVGIAIPVHPLTFVGIGVAVVSLAAGAALRALGHGQPLS
ncbi:HGxxPAAW family protein [Demequina phytophila]|uniref:HGxxPAAW family protein n=1 Tax=Demequina phytophila TaxID=1638981 RepID=UPI000780E670|nr:HGxxPAAW family protein [Demequina phytophila]